MTLKNTLMVQGCTSDAGKSTLVAGLCRLFAKQGIEVAPFKPQNMALNSAVTEDGGEIGRAQALQALAAGVPISVHMNPVLLKPNSDTGAQIILQGQSIGNLNAMDYHAYKPKAAQAVFDSFQILSKQYQTVLIEGAGSPAEVNLRQGDIANMGFAEQVDCPVILIADIDKGGVFAHLVGTLACLSESERNRIKGFVINRFRGDINLLTDGLKWLEQQTSKPVLGVLPYLHGLQLDAEDAINHINALPSQNTPQIKVIAPLFPHISNHTDFDALRLHPQVDFSFITHDMPIPSADLIILPGSKNIAFDLDWFKQQGWPAALQHHLRYAGKLIGICGGLQMLGQTIYDPEEVESPTKSIKGLGLFSYETTLHKQKNLTHSTGTLTLNARQSHFKGYEIHCGITNFSQHNAPMLINGQSAGAISEDNQILATYIHGLFDETDSLENILSWAGLKQAQAFSIADNRQQQLDRLADTLQEHLDIKKIKHIMQIGNTNEQ